MKEVKTTKEFKKKFKERISKNPNLVELFQKAMEYFPQEREVLRDHALSGKQSKYRAFDIAPDCRVTYIETDDLILLVDIGSHKEVYIR